MTILIIWWAGRGRKLWFSTYKIWIYMRFDISKPCKNSTLRADQYMWIIFLEFLWTNIALQYLSELQKLWNVTWSWNVHSKLYTTYFTIIPRKRASKAKNYRMAKKTFHELKILHSIQKFYTILDRVDHRFLQLWYFYYYTSSENFMITTQPIREFYHKCVTSLSFLCLTNTK